MDHAPQPFRLHYRVYRAEILSTVNLSCVCKFLVLKTGVVRGRLTVMRNHGQLPKVCRVELFGWECARERKIITALVDIPEFYPAQFDRAYLQTNYPPCHPALR